MSEEVLQLAARVESSSEQVEGFLPVNAARPGNLEPASARIDCTWGTSQKDPTLGRLRTTFVAHSPAFVHLADIRLHVSREGIAIGAPGAEDVCIDCPFCVDVENVVSKFSSKRKTLTIFLTEGAS